MRHIASLYIFLILILSAVFLGTETIYAQMSNVVSKVTYTEPKEGDNLYIGLEFFQSVAISQAVLYYKPFGENEYKSIDITISGYSGEVTIPAEDVNLPSLDVYFFFKLSETSSETYPFGAPDNATPLQIQVKPKSQKDKEAILLSPEPGRAVPESEFFVSVSLLRASTSVDKAATKIYIDGQDFTQYAVFAEDLILLYPDNATGFEARGQHTVKIELYDYSKQPYHSIEASFNVISDAMAEEKESGFIYSGTLTGESRNENFGGVNTWYNNISLTANGTYQSWSMDTRIYVTSEEKKYRQPNNRYSLTLLSDWLEINVGDHTPAYPSLVMNGKRVRGFSGEVSLGFFNLKTTMGEVTRAIEGKVSQFIAATDPLALGTNVIKVDSIKYGLPLAIASEIGTYKRNIFTLRPSFGRGENFRLGFTYLHAKDDIASIDFGNKPQENVVVGSDMLIAFDDQKVMLTGQAAFSVFNTDISTGTFSDEDLETFIKNLDSTLDVETIKKIKNQASKIITINEGLKPWNPEELPTFGAEGAFSLNYFGNYFRTSYIYRGNEFQSFGNTFIRQDVAGINVFDRIRLLENKLFISGSYEDLKDNLQETKFYTTSYKTINGSVSYFPRTNFPNILFSFAQYNNENNAIAGDSAKIEDITNRFLIQLGYDFFYFYNQQASLSVSVSDRQDNSVYKQNANSFSLNLGVGTTWNDELMTNVTLIYSASEVVTTTTNYFSISLGARKYLMDRKLIIFGSINPSFGDYNRTYFDANAQYQVLRNFSVQAFFRYFINSSTTSIAATNDVVFGLNTRFNW